MVSTNFLTQNMFGNNFLTGGYMNSFSGLGSCNNMFGSIFNYGGYSDNYQGAVIGNTVASIIGIGLTACFAGKVGAKSSEPSVETSIKNIDNQIIDELNKLSDSTNVNNYSNYGEKDIEQEKGYTDLEDAITKKTDELAVLQTKGSELSTELSDLQSKLGAANNNNENGKNNDTIANLNKQIETKKEQIKQNEKAQNNAEKAQKKAEADLEAYKTKRNEEVAAAKINIKSLLSQKAELEAQAEREKAVENNGNIFNRASKSSVAEKYKSSNMNVELSELRTATNEYAKACKNGDNEARKKWAQVLTNMDKTAVENIANGNTAYKSLAQVRNQAAEWLEQQP